MSVADLNISLQQGSLALKGTSDVATTRYEFAFGNYLYDMGFYDELSRIQSAIVSGDTVQIADKTLNMQSPGDFLALQEYMSTISGAKDAIEGLGKGGLKAQYDALSNIKGVI